MSLPLLLAACLAPQAGAAVDSAPVPAPDAAPVRVMSFNVRFDNPGDGPDRWNLRWPLVRAVVLDRAPDVLGVQEALLHQVDALAEALPGHDHVTLGRDPGGRGEHCSVFFARARFTLLEHGTFWLSDTPGEPSRGWDAACHRVATWVRLEERGTGRRLLALNTHFDHEGEEARRLGARLVLGRLDQLRGADPGVLLGDLNVQPDHAVYAALTARLDDAFLVPESAPRGPGGTFCGFDDAATTGKRIDYVLVPRGQRVAACGVAGEVGHGGRAPSDHRAVWADLLPWAAAPPAVIHLEEGWRAASAPPGQHPLFVRADAPLPAADGPQVPDDGPRSEGPADPDGHATPRSFTRAFVPPASWRDRAWTVEVRDAPRGPWRPWTGSRSPAGVARGEGQLEGGPLVLHAAAPLVPVRIAGEVRARLTGTDRGATQR